MTQRALALLLALGLALAACGGDDPADDASVAGAADAPDVSDDEAVPDDPDDVAGAADADEPGAEVCAAVASVDLGAAFGTLSFGEPRPVPGRAMCVVEIVEAEGEGLIVQLVDGRGTYDDKRGYEEQDGITFAEVPGLGDEAFVLNDADLNVLVEGARTLVVAIQAFIVEPGIELPEPEVRVAALTTVAEAVLAG